MRWTKASLRTSIYNLLGNHAPATPVKPQADPEAQTQLVRAAMLESLGDIGSEAYPDVYRKVIFASDIQSLWYCRSELMAALAGMYGEAQARNSLQKISELFHGMLPESLTSRLTQPTRPKR